MPQPLSLPSVSAEESHPKILIVDDDPDILQLLGETLRNATDFPNELVLETDPKSALERLERNPADLVISDYKMPGMDGVDLLLQVKAHHPHTLRMLMTAHSTQQAALAAVLTAEVHSYIKKPFQPGEVLRTIRDAFTRRGGSTQGLGGFVDPADRALELVGDLRRRMQDAPPEASELDLTLAFPSTSDFNHFAARAFELHQGEVKDIHWEEGKFVVTVSCRPEAAPTVVHDAGEVPRAGHRRARG